MNKFLHRICFPYRYICNNKNIILKIIFFLYENYFEEKIKININIKYYS
jgi:hypothetical protein